MVRGVSHIGIAVKDLDAATRTYADVLGMKPGKVHNTGDMEIVMLSLGNAELELMKPVGTEGVIAKFLESRGEGIHHICIEVDDIDKELASLAARGVRLVDKQARAGIEGRVAFIHPKSMNGVLIELVEK